MDPISRRDAGKLLVTGAAWLGLREAPGMSSGKIDSIIHKIQIGTQNYSFKNRPLEAYIKKFKITGLGKCEL